MSRISLLGLIGMILVATTIGIMYIKPTVSEIRTIEDTTNKYKTEIEKVSAVNETLAVKLAQMDALSPADSEALKRYLPDTVDEVAVMKDITQIFAIAGASVDNIVYTAPVDSDETVDTDIIDPYKGLRKYNFTIDSILDTTQLVRVLSALETNDYLMQVSNLNITPTKDNSTLQVSLKLTTFSRALVTAEKK